MTSKGMELLMELNQINLEGIRKLHQTSYVKEANDFLELGWVLI